MTARFRISTKNSIWAGLSKVERDDAMELYQLRYFAKAAAYGNISMAAQDLHVTQPSISKAIKALEKELQVELMFRKGKYCELTHEGRQLQARLRPILKELDAIPGEMRNGHVRHQIQLNALSAGLLVPELIRKFREDYPKVYFRILDSRESINWDFCIRSTLPEVFFNNAVKLMEEKLFLACRKDSWLAEKDTIDLSDLANEDFVMLRSGGSIREISDKRFKDLGFIPKLSYECDNLFILKRVVEEGLGVTIWPEYSWRNRMEREDNDMEICLKPLEIPDFSRSLYLIRQKDIKITEEMEAFSDFTISYFAAINNRNHTFDIIR